MNVDYVSKMSIQPLNSSESIETYNFADISNENEFNRHLNLEGGNTMTIYIDTHGETLYSHGKDVLHSQLLQSRFFINKFSISAEGGISSMTPDDSKYMLFTTSEFCNGRDNRHRFLDVPLLWRESQVSYPEYIKIIEKFGLNPNVELEQMPSFTVLRNREGSETTHYSRSYFNKYFSVGGNLRGIYLCTNCNIGKSMDNLLNDDNFKRFMSSKYGRKYEETEIESNVGSVVGQTVVAHCLLSDIVEFADSGGINHLNVLDSSCAVLTAPSRENRWTHRVVGTAVSIMNTIKDSVNGKGIKRKTRKTRKQRKLNKTKRKLIKYKQNINNVKP